MNVPLGAPVEAVPSHVGLRGPYGLWFVGLSEMSCSLALLEIASGLRPNLRPMTLVGVFPRARSRSWVT